MRKLALALLTALLVSAGGLGVAVERAQAAVPAGAKVVIVVGAVQGITSSYRADAEVIAAEFAKYTSNIVKVYSPNATWAAVQTAAQGASVLVYMGHGSGYPNPYISYLQPNGDNGMGLNYSDGSKPQSDTYTKYYGENYMAQLGLVPNAVVILHRLCYASGNSEPGAGAPSLATAQTRVDGYASGFLRGNARAVIVEGVWSITPYIDALFTTNQTIDQMWKSFPNFHNNVTSWGSTRNPGFTSQIDPDYQHPQSDGDPYYRSLVVQPGLTTNDVGLVKTYAASTYVPLTPTRLLDTRTGNGLSGRLAANTPRTFQVTGRGGVPANATAVTGNVTVVDETDGWAVFVGPDPTPYPGTSTVNFVKGDVTGNGMTVALGTGGTLSATYISSSGNTTNLVFDVTGYFVPDGTGATYTPLTPARLLDTRSGNGLTGVFDANTPRTFQVTNRGGVPSNATAVTGNVTVVDETAGWAVFLGPAPTPAPTSSTINFISGDVKANALTVALSTAGTLSATYMSNEGNTTNLVFDVTGYFVPGTGGAKYVPLAPVRLLDTRASNGMSGKITSNTPRSFQVTGRGGIPSAATGVTGNATIVNETNAWAVFLGPNATTSPTTSNINFVKGDVKSNSLAVALGSGGVLNATYMSTAGQTTDLVVDVTGYFQP